MIDRKRYLVIDYISSLQPTWYLPITVVSAETQSICEYFEYQELRIAISNRNILVLRVQT